MMYNNHVSTKTKMIHALWGRVCGIEWIILLMEYIFIVHSTILQVTGDDKAHQPFKQ